MGVSVKSEPALDATIPETFELEGVVFRRPPWNPSIYLINNELSPEFGEKLKTPGQIPADVELIFPPPDCPITVEWSNDEWVAMHEYPYRLGFKFPMSKSLEGIIRALDVSLGQFLPHFWRVVLSLDRLHQIHGFKWDIKVLKACYSFRGSGGESIGLRSYKGKNPYIPVANTLEDREWAKCFFFIKKSSLGAFGESLRTCWRGWRYLSPFSCFHFSVSILNLTLYLICLFCRQGSIPCPLLQKTKSTLLPS